MASHDFGIVEGSDESKKPKGIYGNFDQFSVTNECGRWGDYVIAINDRFLPAVLAREFQN